MAQATTWTQIADWLISYLIHKHPEREAIRVAAMAGAAGTLGRAGWSLTSATVLRSALPDLVPLLDRIERELLTADPLTQWTMNACLATIGIHHADLRARAIQIGERMGVYRNYPTAKGCVSPFAPIWIQEMVRRADEGEDRST